MGYRIKLGDDGRPICVDDQGKRVSLGQCVSIGFDRERVSIRFDRSCRIDRDARKVMRRAKRTEWLVPRGGDGGED